MSQSQIQAALEAHDEAKRYRLGGTLLRYGNTTNHTEIKRFLLETDEEKLFAEMERVRKEGRPSPLAWVTSCKPGLHHRNLPVL